MVHGQFPRQNGFRLVLALNLPIFGRQARTRYTERATIARKKDASSAPCKLFDSERPFLHEGKINERDVVIGNEAVWTTAQAHAITSPTRERGPTPLPCPWHSLTRRPGAAAFLVDATRFWPEGLAGGDFSGYPEEC